MEVNRNQYFMIGLVVLFLGIQFRLVQSVVLNAKTSEFIAARMQSADAAGDQPPSFFTSSSLSTGNRTLEPPRWIGWMLVSIGGVLVLHSLAMPKPG